MPYIFSKLCGYPEGEAAQSDGLQEKMLRLPLIHGVG
jgi:hypothetical protein